MSIKMIGLVLVLATAVLGCAHPAQPEQYMVAFTASSQGVVLGKPSMLVESETLSAVRVDGADGYDLSFKVTPSESSLALVNATLKTSAGEITPTLLVELGKMATVRVGEIELSVLVRHAGS